MDKIEKLVLASASPRRRELLAQIGIRPEIVPSTIEEKITTDVPEEAVAELSRQKAEDVAGCQQSGTFVIGADTVVAAGGEILGKPATHQEAFRMISMLEGRTHQVYTGVTLVYCGQNGKKVRTFVEKTDVHLYPMSQEEIKAYTDGIEPMDKAGAYGIQGKFAAFIKGIDGDYNNVVGLPVGRVYQEMKLMFEQEDKV
ncbi:Maf family protein [Lacrimispora saccharolytica]|uniref:dTTP/UTP pyrophosphatase n=1 Tax=Lacrimispora saccharolytica (strain ATCC 35040 / DSM 2544 / NRCC 2533 / WM1) TaxID=610130 RepID=D9R8M2_LACSW|nr:Maf family protein [Lacrimispora saccharolytica]ADL05751.1 maf protein [[Clostridium] saccharolyticum WM1]QRV20107.1 septum formation protein Maf [Lacrimispora saccharolytica]